MTNHARLAPSNHRWPNCPGSVREEANYPDNSSAAAIDGTGSHVLLETCLILERRADTFVGELIGVGHEDKMEGWLVDQSRAARVQLALDYINHRIETLGAAIHTESQSNPGHWFGRDDWFGTVDVSLVSHDSKILEIIDLKDGFLFVNEKDNPQLIGYGLGKLLPFVMNKQGNYVESTIVETIRLTIIQPKTENNPIRFVEYTPNQLWQEGLKLITAAKNTDQPDAPLIPGSWCRWCKHSENCKAKMSEEMKGFEMVQENDSQMLMNIDINSISTMNEADLIKILDARVPLKKIIKIVEKAEAEALSRLQTGMEVKGYTIGRGNSSKKWKESEAVTVKKLKGMRFVLKEIYPPKFISPAQALSKEGLTQRQKERLQNQLIEVVPGKPKIVPMKVQVVSAEEMFAEVPEQKKLTDPTMDLNFI